MRKEPKNIFKDQKGAALVIALLMMITLTLIGLGSIFTSTFEMKLSGNKRGATDAFYAADSGIQVTMANINNFNIQEKFVDDKYNPFTDITNPNPTNARVQISHVADQNGSPRGMGFSSTNFEFEHYMINSTGQDQTELAAIKSACVVEEKIIRLVPTLQGGY